MTYATSHNGSGILGNVQVPSTYNCTCFLDYTKQIDGEWIISGGSGDPYSLYDEHAMPAQMPTSGTWANLHLWIDVKKDQVIVVEWPGDAVHEDVVLSGISGASITALDGGAVGTNYTDTGTCYRRYTVSAVTTPYWRDAAQRYANPARLFRLDITKMRAGAFSSKRIKVYKDMYADRIRAGEIFDPRFIEQVKNYGVLRFLNWSAAAASPFVSTAGWQYHAHELDSSYSYGVIRRSTYCGVAAYVSGGSDKTNDFVVAQPPTPITSWTHGQMVQLTTPASGSDATALNFSQITAVDLPTSTFSTSPNAHGIPDGNTVILGGGDINVMGSQWIALAGADRRYTLVRVDDYSFKLRKSDNSLLDVSTGYPAFIAGDYTIYAEVTLKVGNLPPVSCVQPTGGTFVRNHALTFNKAMTGIYDATLGALLLGNYDGANGWWNHKAGVPIEQCVELCKLVGAHPWISLPVNVDASYMTSFLTLLRDIQPVWMKPIVEFGNEVWGGTAPAQYCDYVSLFDSTFGGVRNLHGYYGKSVAILGKTIQTVYAGSGKTCETSIGHQTVNANIGTLKERLKAKTYSGYETQSFDLSKSPDTYAASNHFDTYCGPKLSNTSVSGTYNGHSLLEMAYLWTYGTTNEKEIAYRWLADTCMYCVDVRMSSLTAYYSSGYIPAFSPNLKIRTYEGGQIWFPGGAPGAPSDYTSGTTTDSATTATYSGAYGTQPVTKYNVLDFMLTFKETWHYAAVTEGLFDALKNFGFEMPSVFCAQGSDDWGLWKTDDPDAPARMAARAFFECGAGKKRVRGTLGA